MPLPVVPDTWQVKMVFTGSPLQRPASCAIHLVDQLGTQTEADLWADLDASVTANMWNLVSSNVGVTKVTNTKLDGTSASVDHAITAFPAKWTGSGGADAIPQGAAVVSFKSLLRGPKHRNRIYLPAVAEAKSSDGLLDATTVANATTAWTNFQAAMSALDWQLTVVSPTDQTETSVAQIVVRPNLRNQRRRQRR